MSLLVVFDRTASTTAPAFINCLYRGGRTAAANQFNTNRSTPPRSVPAIKNRRIFPPVRNQNHDDPRYSLTGSVGIIANKKRMGHIGLMARSLLREGIRQRRPRTDTLPGEPSPSPRSRRRKRRGLAPGLNQFAGYLVGDSPHGPRVTLGYILSVYALAAQELDSSCVVYYWTPSC